MSESEEFPFIVPLLNFQSDAESMNLNETTWLRRITPDEFQKLVARLPLGEMYRHWLVWNIYYVLESKMKNFPNILDSVILAFRLLKTGDVKAPIAFQLKEKGEHFLGRPPYAPYVSENIYSLKKEETANVMALWNKLQDLSSKPYLDFPINQFTDAYEKSKPIDKIVDYISAFDSLVFHKESRSYEPAGKIIGIAMGMLFGKNQKERMKIKDTIQRAYDLRSEKLHGNMEKLKKYTEQNIEKLAFEVEDYLRCTLRKFVEE